MESDAQTYWAAHAEAAKLIPAIQERHRKAQERLWRSGRMDRAASMISAYLGYGTDGWKNASRLEDTDVTEWVLNSVRPNVTTALGLIVGQRPTVKPRARNSDAKSLAQTRLAAALQENWANDDSGQELEVTTVRWGLLASSWSLVQSWAPREGDIFGVDGSGVPQHDGALQQFTVPPWRMTYDATAGDVAGRRWCLFARPADKWELAAQAEEMGRAEDAVRLREWNSAVNVAASPSVRLGLLDALLEESLRDGDGVWVWELRHRPTPALPQGRLVRFVDEKLVLTDTPYPYSRDDLHAYEYAPERVGSGTAGHAGMADMLGSQEMLDICTTSMATTANLNGTPHLWSPNDDAPVVNKLASGPTIITTPQKPELLDFPALKPEMVTAAEFALSQGRQAAALNDTVMGQPEKGMPASAQALQRAQAVQYHQVSQAEYVRLVKRAAQGALRIWKKFATTPRTVALVGKDNAYELREWQSDDLSEVEGFDVELVSPGSNTYEARQAQAELFLQQGALKTAEDFLSFTQTGNLRKATSPATRQAELAEKLQAQLLDGRTLPPVDPEASARLGQTVFAVVPGADESRFLLLRASYPHHLLIEAFNAVSNGTDDVAIAQAADDAVAYSLELWRGLDADQCQAFGIPPLPSHLAPPAVGGESSELPPDDMPQAEQAEAADELPAPPADPITGAQPPAPPV